MFDLFLSQAYAPFTVAFLVMIGIGLIEGIGLGLGSLDLHADIGGDADGIHAPDLLGWLGLGNGLPILIWLTSLLGCFTLAGVAIQQVATGMLGAPLHAGIASGGAAVIGLIVNVFVAAGLARIMPGYESTVVSVEDLLIWLTSLLGCFTLAGVAIQQISTGLFGAPLHWGIACAGAAAIGLVGNVFAAAGLARIMPGYESTVVSIEDLLMRRGTILEGTARRGHPARAKVVDQHGQAHYVMVEPHNDSDVVAPGETALLVRRAGPTFFVVPDVDPNLRPI